MREDYSKFIEELLKHRAEGLIHVPWAVPTVATEANVKDAREFTFSAYLKVRAYRRYLHITRVGMSQMSVENALQFDELEWLIDVFEVEIHRILNLRANNWYTDQDVYGDIREFREVQQYVARMWQSYLN